MSGGPVVDMQGRVVGLVSQKSPGETQSFNFAAASSTLLDVLAGKQVDVDLGKHDRAYRAGLDHYFAGDLDDAVDEFDAALAGSPGHLQATEYRRLAVNRGGQPGGAPVLIIVLAVLCAGVAVGAGTAGTAVALTRRRRLAPAGPPLSDMDTPPLGFPMPPMVPVPPVVPVRGGPERDTDKIQRREADAGDQGHQAERDPEPEGR
jgi:hypothetical protein